MNSIALQYLGFLNTPNLWLENSEIGLQQLEIMNTIANVNDLENHKLRLGNLVERFVGKQLEQDASISILTENLQIQNDKVTIGEIDCLLIQNQKTIHLEIVYKFYLYNETVGTTEIDHWIGPNRKDSLTQKLTKLKEKQLPLLYHNCTKPVINKLDLQVETIQQQVCFKAQLYVPLQQHNISFQSINNACIKGFYITKDQIQQFTDCQFYIPEKLDWLIDIPIHNLWKPYNSFLEEIIAFLDTKKAPLCWLKKPSGETEKFFVVWW